MGFSIDFKELTAYNLAIKYFADDFHSFLEKFLVEMAERVIAKVKPRTPVDTGALRNAWQLGDIKGEGQNISVEILNGMEYATEIEYGHRIVSNGVEVGWYDGRFMLKISVNEIRKLIPAKYENLFRAFCKEKGIRYD